MLTAVNDRCLINSQGEIFMQQIPVVDKVSAFALTCHFYTRPTSHKRGQGYNLQSQVDHAGLSRPKPRPKDGLEADANA